MFNLLVFFTVASGVTLLCMIAVKDLAGTTLFAIFYGFCSGAGVYFLRNMRTAFNTKFTLAVSLSVPVIGQSPSGPL